MILQTDPTLGEKVNRFGCYLLCICFLANKWTGRSFTPSDIRWVYCIAADRGWITKDCHIVDPERIFGYLGLPVKYTDRHEPPDRICEADEMEILCFRRSDRDYNHFDVGDGFGHIAYDPAGNSSTSRLGTLMSKRIFRRV